MGSLGLSIRVEENDIMTCSLFEKTARFLDREDIIPEGCTILAAVSGGADSVCLLLLLKQFQAARPFDLHAFHVEHGIRREESLGDLEFVRELCEREKIPFSFCRIDVPGTAASQKRSLEEMARIMRYEALEKERERIGARWIAAAHHSGDQAETVLMNLARGSGIKGLCGMRACSGRIIRPLLDVSRSEIEAWLTERGQEWRTDSTNSDENYSRNSIRLDILPRLEQIYPGAGGHIAGTASIMGEAWDYMRDEASKVLESRLVLSNDEARMSTQGWEKVPHILRMEALMLLLERALPGRGMKDMGTVHLEMLDDLCLGGSGRRSNLPQGLEAQKEYDDLVLFRSDKRTETYKKTPVEIRESGQESGEIGERDARHKACEDIAAQQAGREERDAQQPGPGELWFDPSKEGTYSFGDFIFEVQPVPPSEVPAKIPSKPYTKWISCDKIKGNLCIRTRKRGDYLVINGAGAHKSVQRYMIDEKIPASLRDKVPLLCDGSHVLWAAGGRISEEVKITETTGTVMMISCRAKLPGSRKEIRQERIAGETEK